MKQQKWLLSDRPTYDAGHIAGAQFVDRREISDPGPSLNLQMASVVSRAPVRRVV